MPEVLTPLALKVNLPDTARRFDAWWRGEVLERPLVTLGCASHRQYQGPVSHHKNQRDRWMDVEFVVEQAAQGLACHPYPAETLPIFFPNLGPEITGTLWGCEIEFGQDTSWTRPVVHHPEEWHPVMQREPNFNNPYWQTIEAMTDLALQRGAGQFLVGATDLHGNWDILAALRDPQELCLDMKDCPELLEEAAQQAANGFVACLDRQCGRLLSSQSGCTTWMPLFHTGPAYATSCDFWCMVSPQMARELVLPAILREMEPLERSIFHLDGPQALPHLDLLLELPQLDAVQWVYGEGQGPATRWVEVYRRIRDAGKSYQLVATHAEALEILKELGPQGMWLVCTDPAQSLDEAERYLRVLTSLCTEWRKNHA